MLPDQRPGPLAELARRLEEPFPDAAGDLRRCPGVFSGALSCCRSRGGVIRGVCLVEERGDTAHLRLLYSLPGEGHTAMEALIASMAQVAARPALKRLTTVVTTPQARDILDRLCPDYAITQRLYIAYDLGTDAGA